MTGTTLGPDWDRLGPDQDKGIRRKPEDKGQALPFKILLQTTPGPEKRNSQLLSFPTFCTVFCSHNPHHGLAVCTIYNSAIFLAIMVLESSLETKSLVTVQPF